MSFQLDAVFATTSTRRLDAVGALVRRGRTRVRVPRESCGGFATASLAHSISFPKKLNVEYKVSFRVRRTSRYSRAVARRVPRRRS